MIDTIIFDFDGLLVDSETVFYQLYQDLLIQYGKGFTKKQYGEKYCGRKLTENINDIINDFSLPLSFDEVNNFIEEDEERYIQKGIPLKSGALELLNYLKKNNYKIILATSSLPERAIRILKYNKVENYFNAMVFGPDVKRGKPEPDVFLLAKDNANSNKENCLVLEDSQQGIMAACSAGIKVVCIPDVKMPDKDILVKCEKVYSDLSEVITYLAE